MKNEIRELNQLELDTVAGGMVVGGPRHGDPIINPNPIYNPGYPIGQLPPGMVIGGPHG